MTSSGVDFQMSEINKNDRINLYHHLILIKSFLTPKHIPVTKQDIEMLKISSK